MQATFPHLAMRQASQIHLVGQSLDTGESISGVQTIVPTMRQRWMATVGFALRGEAATLQWQAFLAQMQGRIGTTLVPVHSRYRPKDRNGRPLSFRSVSGLRDAQTWEHFGLENSEITRMKTASAAALRATQIDVDLLDTTGLRPGHCFSIGERLYRVQQHWEPGGAVHRIRFEPPLREAVAAGVHVEIDRPVCKMRMVTEAEGLFDQTLDPLPQVQVTFTEAL